MFSIRGIRITMNLKTIVEDAWRQEGSPDWNYEQTLIACLEADERLRRNKENPAKRFREEAGNKNNPYLRQWVMGCHFEWLNPRK